MGDFPASHAWLLEGISWKSENSPFKRCNHKISKQFIRLYRIHQSPSSENKTYQSTRGGVVVPPTDASWFITRSDPHWFDISKFAKPAPRQDCKRPGTLNPSTSWDLRLWPKLSWDRWEIAPWTACTRCPAESESPSPTSKPGEFLIVSV